MDSQNLMFKLMEYGLSQREANIYISLLKHPNTTPSQIQNHSDIPRTKIYEVLNKLISRGFVVEEVIGKKRTYRAVNPGKAFSGFMKEIEEDFRRKKEIHKEILEISQQLYQEEKLGHHPYDFIEVLLDPKQIFERFVYYEEKARDEILIFSKPPYSKSKYANLETKIDPKVDIKTLWEFDYENEPDRSELENFVQVPNEEIKVIAQLPMKMAVIDRKVTLMSLTHPVTGIQGLFTILLNHQVFSSTMRDVFLNHWEKGKKVEEILKKYNLGG